MPFCNQPDIIRPFLLFGIPQKMSEIAFVILNCPGAFTVGTLSEDETFDEGLNRYAYGCL